MRISPAEAVAHGGGEGVEVRSSAFLRMLQVAARRMRGAGDEAYTLALRGGPCGWLTQTGS